MTIQMTWPQLRDLATARGLTRRLRWSTTGASGKRYVVWLEYGNRTFEAQFQVGHAHGVEFEASYKADIDQVVTEAGLTLVTISAIPENASSYRKSWDYSVAAGATVNKDERIDGLSGSQGVCYLTGGKYRVRSAVNGSKLAFAVVDKDDVAGYFAAYGLTRTRLAGLTGIVGTFQVGEVVTGAGGASGVVLAVGADYLEIRADFSGAWSDGETLTGATSAATATLGAYAVGGELELGRYVEDEWIETGDVSDIDPGGVKKLAQGLYLRSTITNADQTNPLGVTIRLKMARE